MFSSDKDSFRIYHEGYAEQLRKWPKDPLNIIIPSILKQYEKSIPQKIIIFKNLLML